MSEARILLGPILRYVDRHAATIWVETDRPCTVSVTAGELSAAEPTWAIHGRHYALLEIQGLAPATVTPYEVSLDGDRAWPEADSAYPPSVIRTLDSDHSLRLTFGSCRRAARYDAHGLGEHGADALAALADRMSGEPYERWPDALFMAGDQVYADEPSDDMVERLRAAHEPVPPGREEVTEEVWNYEEYAWLYHESWSPAPVRWLLSTVPTCMLLDDHDLRDDWNTSFAWREWVSRQDWWGDRVVGAFASYWVYQHLGNLSPDELARDEMFARVRASSDDEERTRALDEFAWNADADHNSARWSFVRDFDEEGHTVRLVAMDNRASRLLERDRREMIDDAEWRWIVERATERPVSHLLLGCTLPVLLPRGIHHLEGWNEAVSSGRYGRLLANLGERLRRFVDLEHWSAFRSSFAKLVDLLGEVAGGAEPPASILFLSGDVHCSYTSDGRLVNVDHPETVIRQLTMSPFRNFLPLPVKLVNRFFEKMPIREGLRWFSKAFSVPDTGIDWHLDSGPWFQNGLMTVILDGREARLEVDRAVVVDGRQVLERGAERTLTTQERSPAPTA